MAGLTIQEMRLSATAEKAALFVLKLHPEVYFTSGRRDLRDQARAMAMNAISYGAAWLDDTYKNKRIVACLMTHMEEHPEECSKSNAVQLSESFYSLLTEHFADEYARFPHIRGDAFDIRYPRLKNMLFDEPLAQRIIATIRSLPQFGIPLEWATTQEGRLKILHCQFKREPTEVA